MSAFPNEEFTKESWDGRDFPASHTGVRDNMLKEHINSIYQGGAGVAAKDIPPIKGLEVGVMYYDITDSRPYWFDGTTWRGADGVEKV